eukprot:TRINITY_DN538_c0_g4_i4.p1 TRINITY_DN538_c0_g4~~TRINITY_DN538_c0_g4_i4.p1  ORF type:complete len:317 (+),score=83.11 TRINITY_DN538_c0_g4_i4:42-992(+)
MEGSQTEGKKIKRKFKAEMQLLEENSATLSTRSLRKRTTINYAEVENKLLHISKDDSDEEFNPRRKPQKRIKVEREVSEEEEELYYIDNSLPFQKLPKTKSGLLALLKRVDEKVDEYKEQYINEAIENRAKKSSIPENSIPISADVRKFDFHHLASEQLKHAGRLFDVIMMDPPWQLSSSQPSRGVAIAYDSLSDEFIESMPIPALQTDGFIFIWVINAKYRVAIKMMEKWGYKLVDEIIWVKKTVNGKIAKGHGFYLQHAKESCLVGVKGKVEGRCNKNRESDVIFSERRGQSQKPEEIYKMIENFIPNGLPKLS